MVQRTRCEGSARCNRLPVCVAALDTRHLQISGRSSDISVIGAGVYSDKEGGWLVLCCVTCITVDVAPFIDVPCIHCIDPARTLRSAAATGDGDITMRFLPAYQAVENMRNGMEPAAACEAAVRRIMVYYTAFELGLVCLNTTGGYGAASHGWTFTYAAASPETNNTAILIQVPPISA